MPSKTRIFCFANPTPNACDNPYWRDGLGWVDAMGNPKQLPEDPICNFMKKQGFPAAFLVGNETMNRGNWWSQVTNGARDFIPGLRTETIDYSRYGNFVDPPDLQMAAVMGKLAANPTHFWASGMQPNAPLIFDIESITPYNVIPTSSVDQRLAAINTKISVINAARAGANNPDLEVYEWDDPYTFESCIGNEPQIQAALNQYKDVLTGTMPGYYIATPNRNEWLGTINTLERRRVKYYGAQFESTKVASVCPFYQVPNQNDANAALHNTALPLSLWKSSIDLLIDRGYQLFVWTPPIRFDSITDHIFYLKNYAF